MALHLVQSRKAVLRSRGTVVLGVHTPGCIIERRARPDTEAETALPYSKLRNSRVRQAPPPLGSLTILEGTIYEQTDI